jgi:HPt (histidine-containing phosphotransfer) domain-containing protein
MARVSTAAWNVAPDIALSLFSDTPAFDAMDLDEKSDMIGETGVLEMVEIFEADTRRRLRRLAAGDQDIHTLSRELHTLKGAAGTAAAPRLNAMGRMFELEANRGIAPAPDQIDALETALEAYLTGFRAWNQRRLARALSGEL